MTRRHARILGTFLVLAIAALAWPAGTAAPAAPAPAEKVNINTAGVDELATLPGIGPAYARRIVEYRDKNGPFRKPEDLLNVRGIGEKTFTKIRDRITLGKV